MIRQSIFILILSVLPLALAGQDYRSSIGLRGGNSSGITFKGFVDGDKAIEALASTRDGGFQFTMLMQTYRPVLLEYSEHLFFYYGYGAHVGYTRWYKRYKDDITILGHPTYYYVRRSTPVIGADAIAGMEYRMYRVPLAFTLDAKPFVEVFGEDFLKIRPFDFAFSVRYTF